MRVYCFMWLCASLVVIKVKSNCFWDSLQSLCITWFNFMGPCRDESSPKKNAMPELREKVCWSHGDSTAVIGSKQRSLFLREKQLPGDPRQMQKLQSVFVGKQGEALSVSHKSFFQGCNMSIFEFLALVNWEGDWKKTKHAHSKITNSTVSGSKHCLAYANPRASCKVGFIPPATNQQAAASSGLVPCFLSYMSSDWVGHGKKKLMVA